MTTTEIAEGLDLGRRSTYERLERLVSQGFLETKKVGASARVWWRPVGSAPSDLPTSTPDLPAAAKSLLDDVLDAPEVGIVVLTEDFDVAWINDATERYFGLDREHVLGRDKERLAEESIAPVIEDTNEFLQRLRATYEDNTGTERFECHVTPGDDRQERWLEHWSKPIETGAYAGGRVELYYDITDRKCSGRTRHIDRSQFESLVEAVEEYAIFLLDPDGYVQSWNSGAERIKGYAADEIVGEHFSTFYTEGDRAEGVPDRNLARAAEQGSIEEEGWRVRADDRRFWANVAITAIHDDEGDLQGYAKVTRDMTDRHDREQSVRDEKALLESLLDNQRDLVYAFDRDGTFLRWNDCWEEVTGYSPVELRQMEPADFIADEAVEESTAAIDRIFEAGASETVELPLETADGTTIPYAFSGAPLEDDEGNVVGFTGIGRDVSERKARERELERQRADLAAELDEMFERVDEAFVALDDDWRFTYVNEQATTVLERSAGELLGQNLWEAFPEAEGTLFQAQFQRAVETQESVTFEEYYPPLSTWFEFSAYPSETGLSVYFRDVTQRKRRQRELAQYATLFEESKDVNVIVDEDGTFRYLTPSVETVFGYDQEELVGEVGFDYIHPDDRAEAMEEFAKMLEEPGYEPTIEFRFKRGDGSWITLEALARDLRDDPNIEGIVVYTRDVTGRKEREERLEQYETLTQAASDVIVSIDTNSVIREVNPAVADVFGYEPEDIVGESLTMLMPDRFSERHLEAMQNYLRTGERNIDWDYVELPGVRADGTEISLAISFSEYEHGDERYFTGIIRDITERKRRERELQRYTGVIDAVGEPVYELDAEGRFTFVNEAFVEQSGYEEEELLGEYVSIGMDEEAIARAKDQMMDLLAAGGEGNTTLEYEVVTKDGERIPVENRISLLLDEDGQFQGSAGVLRDITERKQRERELETRIHQQAVVTDLGQRALEYRDLDELMAEAADLVAETLDNDYCKVLDLDDEVDELLLRQGVGWNEGIVGEATVSAIETDSQAAHTLSSEEPVVVEDLTTETRFSGPDLLTDHDVRSGISTVIGPCEAPWGILGTHDTSSKEFSQQDVNFVQSVATILASAIRRHEDEQELIRQRERLAALNNVNEVVREIMNAVIDQSSREEIERVVCETLAESESYEFAVIAETDPTEKRLRPRIEVGVDGYLEELAISTDPDEPGGQGPGARVLRTGEMQVSSDIFTDPGFEPYREDAKAYGYRSVAAIPISHEGTLYGILGVYSQRTDAFTGAERAVIGQLGEVVGHAIAATERKQALMSDEVVELEVQVLDLFKSLDFDAPPGTIRFEQTVAIENDEFLVYGHVTEDARDSLVRLIEHRPHWLDISFHEDHGETTFELRVSDPPVLSAIASLGGSLESTVIEGGEVRITIHLAPGADTRTILDVIEETYPTANLVKRRQFTRQTDRGERITRVIAEDLTDRQRAVLQASYHAGFFEWPRRATAEEVADSLEIASSTFHQHLRKAQQKVFDTAFSAPVETQGAP